MKDEIQMIVLGGVILTAVLLDKLQTGVVLRTLIRRQRSAETDDNTKG